MIRSIVACWTLGARPLFATHCALCCSLIFSLSAFAATNFSSADDSTPGLVKQRPEGKRFVEIDGGFMVPFRQTILGTKVSFEMVPIAGGTFLIGSPEGEAERGADEGPQVTIEIPPFWIGKYEVTWAEYRNYMDLTLAFEQFDDQKIRQVDDSNRVDAITSPSKLYDPSFTFACGDGPRQPAVSMSQYAAKQYTKWLSLLADQFYRLPTEAEWEYACRAGTTTAYSFGDDPKQLGDYAWIYDNADDQTHDVGQKLPNPWGLYDMHGNASEWTLDEHRAEWYGELKKRGEPVGAADAVCWPSQLYPRVLRGGSWFFDPPDCRSAKRRLSNDDDWRSYDPNTPKSPWWFASDMSQDVGFRIVRPLHLLPKAERSRYWEADDANIERVANQRIDQEGRGERGVVDPALPQAIRELSDPAGASSK